MESSAAFLLLVVAPVFVLFGGDLVKESAPQKTDYFWLFMLLRLLCCGSNEFQRNRRGTRQYHETAC